MSFVMLRTCNWPHYGSCSSVCPSVCLFVPYGPYLTLPYLIFGVGRLLHLPSAEAVSVRPSAQPRCNQKVTVIGCEAEKSPAAWDWWRVVWLFLSCGLLLVSSSPSDYKSSGSSVHKPHHHGKVADHGGGPIRAHNLKTEMRRTTKIRANVPQGRNNRCANF